MPIHEDEFLERIVAQPDDDDLRRVYADWLRDQDDPRAERRARFLDAQAANQPISKRQKQALAPEWVAVVDRTPLQCRRDGFSFECPKTWESMKRIEEDDRIRFCEACQERVHFCTTLDEARDFGRLGRCVALASHLEAERAGWGGRRGRWIAPERELRQLVDELGVTPCGQVGHELWHRGRSGGLDFGVQLVRDAGGWWRTSVPRLVVGTTSALQVTLWLRRRVPHDAGFPFGGQGREAVPAALRKALTRFRHDVGRLHVRPRAGAALPEDLLPDATLLFVHPLEGRAWEPQHYASRLRRLAGIVAAWPP